MTQPPLGPVLTHLWSCRAAQTASSLACSQHEVWIEPAFALAGPLLAPGLKEKPKKSYLIVKWLLRVSRTEPPAQQRESPLSLGTQLLLLHPSGPGAPLPPPETALWPARIPKWSQNPTTSRKHKAQLPSPQAYLSTLLIQFCRRRTHLDVVDAEGLVQCRNDFNTEQVTQKSFTL